MDESEPFYHQLKQLRVAQGIELADIARSTRIDPRFLKAMEEGEFDILPMTYIRLFLRSYCEHIGKDFKEVVADLEAFTGEERRDDLPSYAEELPGTASDLAVEAANTTGRRSPVRLRQDILTGSAIIIFLVLLTVFARKAYLPPTLETGNSIAGPQTTDPAGLPDGGSSLAATNGRANPRSGSQPVVPFESSMEFPEELFTQDRIVNNLVERVRLTPPVRLTLMARDNLVVQAITGGNPQIPFNMTVAKAKIWTVNEELLLRTTGIHLLRGDLNGVPINFGQAQGLGTLRITPQGIYEVSAFLAE